MSGEESRRLVVTQTPVKVYQLSWWEKFSRSKKKKYTTTTTTAAAAADQMQETIHKR